LKKVKLGTIIRTVVLALTLINQIITAIDPSVFGLDEIPYTNIISGIAAASAAVWTWWKNNSFTQAALSGDEQMEQTRRQELRMKQKYK